MSQHDTLLSLRETLRRLGAERPLSVYAPHLERVKAVLVTGEEAGAVIGDAQAAMRKNGHAL